MLTAVESDSVSLWCRLSGPFEVSFRYADNPLMENLLVSTTSVARAEDDYTTVVRIDSLDSDKTYWLEPRIEGGRPKYLGKKLPFPVRTAPEGDVQFSIAFGSCARVHEDAEQPIWKAVAEANPDLFFWLGDNIYADTLLPSIFAEEYRKQRSIPGLQSLLRSTPQFAIWDDHDFGLNDHDVENPGKIDALRVFKNYWNNPGYGEADNPGVYFKYQYGGVEFFFLDVRYHRSPYFEEDGPDKTMLGRRQMEWLKEHLKESEAGFKVLLSGSGWTSLKGPVGDSWAGFLRERNELFGWIQKHEIGGVLLVSGDTHRGELYAIPWSEKGGYDFYEFVSSPLAQDVNAAIYRNIWEVYLDEPYTGGTNFGLMRFDMTQDDPLLSYDLVNQYGDRVIRSFTLRASELVNGVTSWSKRASESEIERHQTWKEEAGEE